MMKLLNVLNVNSMEEGYKKAREIEWNVMMDKKEYPREVVRAASIMITRFDLLESLDIEVELNEVELNYEFV